MAYKLLNIISTPVDIEAVKKHCYIAGSEEDDMLQLYARAACERFTQATGFVVPESEWLYTASDFNNVRLYRGPILEITEIKYTAPDGEAKTVSPADVHYSYERPTDLVCDGGWPKTNGKPGNVRIKFKAGHDDSNELPDLVKWAMLVAVANMYEHREEAVTGTIVSELPSSVNMVIRMYEIQEVL